MAAGGGEEERRPQFGSRLLHDGNDVFKHNAWDDVEWDDERETEARRAVEENSSMFLSREQRDDYEQNSAHYWDKFYEQHQNKFFKDRHWLFTEFSELTVKENDARKEIKFFEVGCGAGNTVFPILRTNCGGDDDDANLFVYCCDVSKEAVDLVTSHAEYDSRRCAAFVADVADESTPFPFPESSLDVVILIFVLSAICPEKMRRVVARLARHLKVGGRILFRDYGRYDLAQLRFKPGRCLSAHFYARGDGTRVYFFTREEVREIFCECGAGLVEEQNLVDRRLIVNRGKRLTMYRVWIQAKFRKT
ncbi:tRNA N(3)-methylcytidine methyltransferase METTL2-like [Oscarella lobularis]|uniref:tRNA N(3)-methylcytidine methyltransferase METTL2-like n=1 Tax=Oscarella lobularis TaxID=121494 RepID=UPI0033137DBB